MLKCVAACQECVNVADGKGISSNYATVVKLGRIQEIKKGLAQLDGRLCTKPSDTEPVHSTKPCPVCNSPLAGTRIRCIVL